MTREELFGQPLYVLHVTGWPCGRPTRRASGTSRRPARAVYCNVEGVSWLSADTVVVVSDRARRNGQEQRRRAKDQSIHVFAIPAAG